MSISSIIDKKDLASLISRYILITSAVFDYNPHTNENIIRFDFNVNGSKITLLKRIKKIKIEHDELNKLISDMSKEFNDLLFQCIDWNKIRDVFEEANKKEG